MRVRRSLGVAGVGLATLVALVTPAGATNGGSATNYSGNTQPIPSGYQNQNGKCASVKHWVYVSSGVESNYNPLGKTTDDLGSNLKAPPAGNADAFNDGVTIAIAPDTKSISFVINETIDPSTTIKVEKVVVKAGPGFSVYTGAAAAQNTPLRSPVGSTTYGVSHAYVCYFAVVSPPPSVPEAGLVALLPVSAIAIGGTIFLLRRRRDPLAGA